MAETRSKAPEPWLDPHAEAYVRIDNITKRFGNFVAVNNVSLRIFKGEIFCLLGGSGCGKTTLLRLLAGLETPDAGRILIDGEDITRVPPHLRPVNMMFQSYALFPHMDVTANVGYGLRREGVARAEIDARVGQALADTADVGRLETTTVRPDPLVVVAGNGHAVAGHECSLGLGDPRPFQMCNAAYARQGRQASAMVRSRAGDDSPRPRSRARSPWGKASGQPRARMAMYWAVHSPMPG